MNKVKKTILLILLAAISISSALTAVLLMLRSKTDVAPPLIVSANLIESVQPTGDLQVSENQIVQVTVRAAADCTVFVKLGVNRVDAAATGLPENGKNTFCAFLTMPQTRAEIESLGYLSVTAQRGDDSETRQAARLVYGQVIANADTSQTYDSDFLDVGNQIETTSPPEPVTEAPRAFAPITVPAGAQLCRISVEEADTWSPGATDDTFVPSNTPLALGTMDYITGRTQVFDAEEQETRDFVILASGRKVKTDAVMLVQGLTVGENQMQILSSSSVNGTLQLRIQTVWSVPYEVSLTPQGYYAARGKSYHVTDFTAQQIQFTFFYTSGATGTADCSGSDVVSSANWTVDPVSKTATLTLPLRETGHYYGYSLRRESDTSFILTIQNRPRTLAGTVIVLDPGHGGKDSGALGYSGAVKESQLNFALAVATKTALEQRGATVILTRTDDVYYTLEERKQFARAQNPDLFLSIHCNAAPNSTRYGTSVYYFRSMSQPLASALYQQLHALFRDTFYAGDSARQAKAGEGAFYHPFSVTRLECCPSVLIETGYVTNDRECALLLDAGNRDKVAAAIANGVEAYLSR